jgi:hypothetical protein
MENSTLTRKKYLEKDILDVLHRAVEERTEMQFDFEKFIFDKEKVENIPAYRLVPMEDKNYSSYRKLLDTLKKSIDVYKRYPYSCSNQDDIFYNKILINMNKELEEIQTLKEDSLKRRNDEQYRCLVDCFNKLLEIIEGIERSAPLGGLKINLDKETIEIDKGNLERTITALTESKKLVDYYRCPECGMDLRLINSNFYGSKKTEGFDTTMCKPCARKYVLKSEGHLIAYLKRIDVPFIRRLWNNSNNDLGKYLVKISLENIVRDTAFKDSEFI